MTDTESQSITMEMLTEASSAGGSSALTSRTRLAPAAGEQALVAPARYAGRGGSTYVFERRLVHAEPVSTVLIDSRTSAANRLEDALSQAIANGHSLLSRIPRMRVSYSQAEPSVHFLDIDLPHRAFDAHVRLGSHDGRPVTEDETYRNARNASPDRAKALFDLSPDTVLFGGWDSTRKSHQARFPASVVGEIIGILADQSHPDSPEDVVTRRSGARIDPLAPSFDLSPTAVKSLGANLGPDVSDKARKAKKASDFLLGAIPPGVDALDGVATSGIIRTHVLSFASLRQLRFGTGSDGDVAIRALLAALAIDLIARSDAELALRANTHLVEIEHPNLVLDRRYGERTKLTPPTISEADTLLEAALNRAAKVANVDWHGQVYEIEGNPAIPGAADATHDAK
ncbi:MAG: type I-U CRISPR-associated RAMP protein Csb1/Cas7u [Microbacteriaceae bacterium]|jgi:CRISPR-associated protein Csb1|nr:type I-U CRISPR-associated RAMP protein Csb1/Cas7u [Microbacteriaceae bacterium]MCI1207534.1 type I-U CRISPR-associated RAMP protein Csb1/Cas7u [Microbacteriaceae bacterium]